MFEKIELTRMAQALAAYSGSRMAVVARNIANADTPGFRASDLPSFSETYSRADRFSLRASRPGHFSSSPENLALRPEFSGGSMSPNGNDVSLDIQMLKSAEVRQSHEMALAVYRSTSSILRLSLGRSG